MLQKAGPERYLKIQKAFLRGFPEVSFCSSPSLGFVRVFFSRCWISQSQASDGNCCFLRGTGGESVGCYLQKSSLPRLGVQHLPRAEACLVFHHCTHFWLQTVISQLPIFFSHALHAVHKMSCSIVCYSSCLG